MQMMLLPLPQLTPRRYTKAACILAKDFRRHVERMAEDSLRVHYELVTVCECCRVRWENNWKYVCVYRGNHVNNAIVVHSYD